MAGSFIALQAICTANLPRGAKNEGLLPIKRLCQIMDVSARGYRAWRTRPMSKTQRADLVVLAHIRDQFALFLGSYGRPRMATELQELGLAVGKRKVGHPRSADFGLDKSPAGRWMRETSIALKRNKKFTVTTGSNHSFNIPPNLLDRDFFAEHPNPKWAGDISYVWTREGWLYLAVIIDLHSRRVIGWAPSRDIALRCSTGQWCNSRMKRSLATKRVL